MHVLLPVTCLGTYLIAGLVCWAEDYWMPEWDGATYLVVAKAMAAGEGYSYQGEPFFLRPPGLSWFLSLLVNEQGFDALRVNRSMMLFAGLAVISVFVMVRTLHDTWLALGATLLTAASPLWLDLHNWVYSEFPFTILLFLAIALFQLAERPSARWWVGALAGTVCLIAAVHVRTVGVLLLPGVVLLAALRGRGLSRLRGLLPAVVVSLALVPWIRYSSAVAAAAEHPAEQTLLLDYTTAMFHVDTGDPDSPLVDLAGWVERIRENGDGLLGDLVGAVLQVDGDCVIARSALILAVLFGLVFAVRRRGPSLLEWFTLSYGALVFTYFVYDPRLAQPLVPFVYLYLLTASAEAGRWLAKRLARPVLVPAAGVVVLLALAAAEVVALGESNRGEPRRAFADAQEEIARWIREKTPAEARILCNQAPVFRLLTGRRTFTYRYMRSRNILARTAPDYVVFDGAAPPRFITHVVNHGVKRWKPPIGLTEYTLIVRIE